MMPWAKVKDGARAMGKAKDKVGSLIVIRVEVWVIHIGFVRARGMRKRLVVHCVTSVKASDTKGQSVLAKEVANTHQKETERAKVKETERAKERVKDTGNRRLA